MFWTVLSRPSRALTVLGRLRFPLLCLWITSLLLMVTAAAAPAAFAVVSFSGPTNFPTGATPTMVATGDFNGDLRPDLAVANRGSGNVSILLGNGSGGFTGATNFSAGGGPRAIVVGYFNGDSDPDLAVANYQSDEVSIL